MIMNITHSLRGLEWLVEELETSLGLALEALHTFQSEPEDASQLNFALGYLHQVSGSLTMAECYGAVMLANEMEAVLKMLLREPSVGVGNACEALELTMQALPGYVRNLLDGCDDTLIQLIWQVNELRAVRAEPLISATTLFMPKVALSNQLAPADIDSEMLGKLQKEYQYALLGYLKQQDSAANQQKIVAVLGRLKGLFTTGSLASLWRVASVFFIALADKQIRQSAATQRLLWELDKTMGHQFQPEGFGSQFEDLLRNLLYYIALAPGESPDLKAIKEEFALDQAVPSLSLVEVEGALQTRLDGTVVTALSDTLSAEVASLVDAVGVFESAEQVTQNGLSQIKLSAERLATTLMVIGQIKLCQSLLEVVGLADQALVNARSELPTAITRLQSIQQSLQTWAENYDDAPLASDLLSETAYVVDDAQCSLIREVRNNFESIKESIVGYIASQWDAQFLVDMPLQFEHIYGAVDVIGLKRVAQIVEQLGSYITRHLLHSEQPPEWSELDALADAITGFEYYLEAIDKGREGEQHDMLRLTVRAMEKLGFDVETPAISASVDVEFDADTSELNSAESAGENSDDIDPEIKEIFIDEVEEVLTAFETNYSGWLLDQTDHKLLSELRRGFHTLKGSGRMVKANVIGDLAWAIENMLNKILDSSGAVVPETAQLVELSLILIPSLLDEFERGAQHLSPYCASLICAAEALTKGEPVAMPQSEEQFVEFENLEELDGDLLGSMAVEELEGSVEVQPVVEIFVGEAQGYIDTLSNFLENFQQPHDDSRLAPADVQRALHTLQASAGMAGIRAVQQLAKTFEDFLSELFAAGQDVSSNLIILLLQGVDQLRTTLTRLETGEGEDSLVLQEYCARVELARTQWQEQKANNLAPQGLARIQQLMATGLDNLLLADTLLEQWSRQVSFSRQDIEPVVSELMELRAAVDGSGVLALSALCDDLIRTLSKLTDSGEGFNEDALRVFKVAHELLLNMIDTVAIGQPVSSAPADLLAQLEALVAMPVEAQIIDFTLDVTETTPQQPTSTDELASRMASEVYDSDALPFFLEEADDLLEDIENALQVWRDEPSDVGQGETLNRALHTLKGGARMAGLSLLGDLSHDLEAFILQQGDQLARGETGVFDQLFVHYDELVSVLDRVKSGDELSVTEELPVLDPVLAPEAVIAVETLTVPKITEPALQQSMSSDGLANSMEGEVHDPEVLSFFLEEADGLLENIENAMQVWQEEPSDVSQSETLNRELHTLKGGARVAGLNLLGDLSHDLETLILQEERQLASGEARVFDQLFARYDELVSIVEWLKSGGAVLAEEESVVPSIETVAELEPLASLDIPQSVTEEVLEVEGAKDKIHKDKTLEKDVFKEEEIKAGGDAVTFPDQLEHVLTPTRLTPASVTEPVGRVKPTVLVQESVKIPAQVLDDLVNLAGEASIARGRVEQGVGESAIALDEMEETIARLRNQVRQLGRQTEAQIQFRREQIESSQSTDFDPLELDRYSQLQQLSQGLEESGSDLQDLKNTLLEKSQVVERLLLMQSRITQDLQENLMKTRLVPFSRLVPRLRRIVRQVGQELGKQVNLGLSNIEGEMDRSVLEKIITPIEHMLRNAIDHGIERAEQRLAAGKPSDGNISLSFLREGGEIVIAVADDGRGLDVAAIRDKAISQKMITADTQATDSELLRLIFQPGFSTAAAVSQVSGRGVGMDVVKTDVHQLGGSISIESALGEGVEFTIRLPFTVSVNKALLVKEGTSTYALPLNSIEGVTQLSAEEFDELHSEPGMRLEYAGLDYQLCTLGSLLHGGRESVSAASGKAVMILVEVDHYRYAVHVEAIEGNQEIIIKGLGAQFNDVRGVSGATILASGDVVVILDLPSLLRSKGEISILEAPLQVNDSLQDSVFEAMPSGSFTPKTIMVVDDSVTVRKVTSRVLERKGFRVVTAKDGIEATDMLAEVKPDLMLLDIEMPRMDGFEVARAVRESDTFADLPLIMISSRTGGKHQQRAASLGVNKFLGKPYQEDELLGLLDELLSFDVA